MDSRSLVLEGLPDDLEHVRSKVELYFKNKRRSGGEILRVEEHEQDKRKALLIYLNDEDLNKVLDKNIHKVDFKSHGSVALTVKLQEETKIRKTKPPVLPKPEKSLLLKSSAGPVCPAGNPTAAAKDVEDDSEIPDLLITSPRSLDKEALQMYFEQFTEQFELTKHGNDRWTLKLYSQSDLKKILSKEEHEFGIGVEVRRAGAVGAQWDPRRFILTGFDGATDRSRISLFIGSGSTTTEYVWEPLDEGSVMVTFRHDIDVKSFIKKCTSKQLQGRDIGVTRVERTDSVLVQGDLERISADVLMLYFSNTKRSGGGEIQSLIWIDRLKSVALTFGNADDAQAVVEQQHHSVCGTDLHTSLYYSRLQKALTGEIPNLTDTVTKVTIPICEDLLRFFESNERCRKDLESDAALLHTKVALDTTGLTLEMDVDRNSLAALLISPDWESRITREIHPILSQFNTEELSAEPEVWSRAERDCGGLVTAGTALSYRQTGSKVIVAGLKDEVKALAVKIGALVRNAAAEVEKERNTVEVTIQLDSAEAFELIEERTRPQLGQLTSSFDDQRHLLSLRGLKDNIHLAETLIKQTQKNLVTYPLAFSSNLSRFVRSLDARRFVQEHFIPNRIPARLLTRTDLLGILVEKENLKRAEDKIIEILQEQVIPLSPSQTGEVWTLFLRNLQEEAESLQKDNDIKITQSNMQLTICGFTKAVADVTGKVKRYLETKEPVTESLSLRSVREAEFVESCLSLSDLPELKRLGTTVLMCRTTATPCLKVTAAKDNVREAVAVIQKLVSSVVVEKHKYSKAGEAKVLEKHKASVKIKAKEMQCSLYLSQEHPVQTPTPAIQTPAVPNTSVPIPVQFLKLKHGSDRKVVINGVPIFLKKSDIVKVTADVIVNSTNKSLDLDTGVSGAILKAAGKSVVDECKKKAPLKAGEVVLTAPGALPCKNIAQMVGPDNITNITESLAKVLSLCEGSKATSLAIPAIGTGRGGFDPKDSIKAMLTAIQKHLMEPNSTSIKSISVVAFEQKTFDAFRELFKEWNKPAYGKMPENQVKFGGVRIEVKKGNITTETVRGIVNSTNRDMSLRTGVSGAVFAAAGVTVNQECQKHGPLQGDEAAVTGPGNLQCDAIIHMLGPHTALEVRTRVRKVLERCEQKQITTVSFPAVGTGGGGVPAADAVTAMLQAVEDHLAGNTATIIKLIYIVTDRDDVLQEFQKGIKTWTTNKQDSEEEDEDYSSTEGSSSSDEEADMSTNPVEVMMGPIKVKVSCGDITKETVDAIVNSTTTTLDLSSGVSGAILKASGQSVVNECKKKAPQPADGVVITTAGNLKNLKHIIHMVGQTNEKGISSSTYKVLKMCEENQIKSVSFPALGTGAGNMAASTVANAMTDALKNFIKDSPKHLKLVRICIFQAKLLPDFQEAVKKCKMISLKASPQRTKTVPTPAAKNLPAVCLEKETAAISFPIMTVEVYGTSGTNLATVKTLLDKLLSDECDSKDIQSKHIANLPESHKKAIITLSRDQQVCVRVTSPGQLTVSGKRDDVLGAVLKINDFLQEVRERESRDGEVKRLWKTLIWEVARGERWEPLEPSVSYDIELAFHRKQKSFQFQEGRETFTVNFSEMRLTSGGRESCRIKRSLLGDSDTAIIHPPPTWTKMDGQDLVIVTLQSDSEEFKKVSTEFLGSSLHPNVSRVQVQQIDRVQSQSQWQRYCVLKQAVDKKYPKQSNERLLYHGTTKDICQKINKNGFNRSFCGRNAVVHGDGTYFAREAWYSCQDQYSNPDDSKLKYIYRARVVTGSLCKSRQGMKEPDPLSAADPRAGLHDCAVDNLQNPFIFVVFCDAGAYPEYLITFRSL